MQVISDLLDYAVSKKMIFERDRIYCQNQILSLLKINDPSELNDVVCSVDKSNIDELLAPLVQLAVDKKIIESTHPDFADLFDTAIMGCLCPLPSTVQDIFEQSETTKQATDYLYNLNIDSNYVRMNRIKKNIQWTTTTPVGNIQISINLSKPEKDPKMIALQKNAISSSYPKCLLCKENEGFAGTLSHPARQNLRAVELSLGQESWYLQYSPYIYYPEHSIVFSSEHRPMVISKKTFSNLLEFIEKYPHYMIGSNSDIPIVGGSILSHDHYQAGSCIFPIDNAMTVKSWEYDEVEVQQIDWALNVIRLRSNNKDKLVKLADSILQYWINYEDQSLGILKSTNGERHNAITPFARVKDGCFELDLTLRNNITTDEHPLGVFHPHTDKHHIKKENIGLIEVMGLAILPSRLLEEMEVVKTHLLSKDLINIPESCQKHISWMESILKKHNINSSNIDEIIQDEIGLVFYNVLTDCKVIKSDEDLSIFIHEMLSSLN